MLSGKNNQKGTLTDKKAVKMNFLMAFLVFCG